jgi:ferrous iron transport protein A
MKLRGTEPMRSAICDSDQNGRILNSDHNGRSLRVLPFRRPQGVRQLRVLTDLSIGESATLVGLDLPESVQNYLMHMGFVPDAEVMALRRAPAGDPTVYAIDGMEIALRRETAEGIRVRTITDKPQAKNAGDVEKAAEATGNSTQPEIHEFAGATR